VKTRTAVGLWTLALLLAAGAALLALTSNHKDRSETEAILAAAVGLAFVGSGLVAWYRRPENRTGRLMVLVGFTWFTGSLVAADNAYVFSAGAALAFVAWGFFAYLMLAFPTGVLDGRAARAIVVGAFLVVTIGRFPYMLVNDLRDSYPGAPENVFLISQSRAASTVIETLVQISALALIVGVVAVLIRRWRRATPAFRRVLTPVFATFGVTVLTLGTWIAFDAFDFPGDTLVYALALTALLTVPLAFLLGLLRTRLARSSVSQLVLELGEGAVHGNLRGALARALGDPSVQVVYPVGEGIYADVEGNRVELPREDGRRATTFVERDGRCIAALIHDASLREDATLVEAVAAAAGLALENQRRLAALADSEARNRALLDALPDLMFRIGRDGTYLDFKGKAADLAAPPETLIGSKVHDILPHEAANRIMRCATKVLERGTRLETVEYELRLQDVDRYFEARVVPSGDDEVLLIVRDITERKHAETQIQSLQDELRARYAQLERERDFIRAVVQAAPSFFCLVDPHGRIVRFNRTLELAAGISDEEEVRGKHFCEVFIAPEERGSVVREMIDVFAARAFGERESHWITADGRRLLVAWSATPIVDASGEQRYLISGIDITERKRHEEEIRASRARLVEAADVERRRLERNLHDGAQQRLVALSISLRLAHGKLESDPEAARQILNDAGDQLAHALEELRELARGIHPAVLTDRGLEPALQALVARTPLPVTVAEAPDDRLPEPVEAAAYYVVSEALANMTKYAQASAATIRIARDNGRAVVEVCDDGVGGADPGQGSGLRGLTDRVEALDGRLEIDSAPGHGTRIRAEIPVADAAGTSA
jgi:PAS domain S-box-containing protein